MQTLWSLSNGDLRGVETFFEVPKSTTSDRPHCKFAHLSTTTTHRWYTSSRTSQRFRTKLDMPTAWHLHSYWFLLENFSAIGNKSAWRLTRMALNPHGDKPAWWLTHMAVNLHGSQSPINLLLKLLWRAYRKSPTLFQMIPPVNPTTSPSFRLGFTTPNQNSNRYYLRNGQAYAFQIFYAHSKIFMALIYNAHRAVIFAIWQLSCLISMWYMYTCIWGNLSSSNSIILICHGQRVDRGRCKMHHTLFTTTQAVKHRSWGGSTRGHYSHSWGVQTPVPWKTSSTVGRGDFTAWFEQLRAKGL